jgi:hypothetical protein
LRRRQNGVVSLFLAEAVAAFILERRIAGAAIGRHAMFPQKVVANLEFSLAATPWMT